jgi:hypothetical protein
VNAGTCGEVVWWDPVQASSPLSTLAGVLAGFLILAATTAIFAPWDRYRWRTVSQFAAGVPALTISGFIFAFIYGTKVDPPGQDPLSQLVYHRRCDQLWSQWLLAAGLLATGAAVLICGFSWLVVGYTENKAKERYNKQIAANIFYRDADWLTDKRLQAEVFRKFHYLKKDRVSLIRAAGWISAVGIMSAAIVLMTVDILYIKAVGLAEWKVPTPRTWPASTNLYLAFLIWGAGLHTLLRTGFVVWTRTRGAVKANEIACKHARKVVLTAEVLKNLKPPEQEDLRIVLTMKKWLISWRRRARKWFISNILQLVERRIWLGRPIKEAIKQSLSEAPREIATLATTVYLALVFAKHTVHGSECHRTGNKCSELTTATIFGQFSAFCSVGLYILLMYLTLKGLKISVDTWLLSHRRREDRFKPPLDPVELLEAKYRHGRPAVVTGHVVASVIFSIGLAGILFQWDFQISNVQLGAALSLLVAGLHPFLILRGLAEAVASGGAAPKVPPWKQETRLGLLFP